MRYIIDVAQEYLYYRQYNNFSLDKYISKMGTELSKLPKFAFPELHDARVAEAVREAEKKGIIQSPVGGSESNLDDIEKGFNYINALSTMVSGGVDGILSGACVAKWKYLHMLIKQEGILLKNPVFSISPIEIELGVKKTLYITDAVVRVSPSPDTLAKMAIAASRVVKSIEGVLPQIALISYSERPTSSDAVKTDVIRRLLEQRDINVYPVPVQIDTALVMSSRELKIGKGYPNANILVFPEITSANVFYKTLSVFADHKVRTCGAFLQGVESGVVGIVSRSSTSGEIFRVICFMAELAKSKRHLTT